MIFCGHKKDATMDFWSKIIVDQNDCNAKKKLKTTNHKQAPNSKWRLQLEVQNASIEVERKCTKLYNVKVQEKAGKT